jgi:hypothetical protein
MIVRLCKSYILNFKHSGLSYTPQNVGFKLLTAEVMESSVIWVIKPRNPLKFKIFCCVLHAGFLLSSLFFDSKDEGDMFIRNVVDFQALPDFISQ